MTSKNNEISILKPDALSPAEIETKAENIGISKATMPAYKLIVLGILAGMFIGFGGMFFCTVLGDTTLSFAVTRVLGGASFCLGLTLVLCCGAELFTGNCLMVCALFSKKISAKALLRNWILVWIGNFLGSLIVVLFVFASGLQNMNSGGVGAAMLSVAIGKVTPSASTLLFKGILCNILVCLAVWIGFAGKTIVDKVIGLFLPITAFVACGFEHCVANMFFLPMAFVLKITGFASAANIDALTIGSIFYNIGIVTLGNIIGGACFVGLLYWIVYAKRK